MLSEHKETPRSGTLGVADHPGVRRRFPPWRLGSTLRRARFTSGSPACWASSASAEIGSPTTAALVALYVAGLVLLDARPTQTRVSRVLPGRGHDALNRLLRTMPLSTRALMGGLLRLARRPEPAPGHAGVPVRGRRGDREAVRQAAAVGGLDVLVRQEAQGLRLPRRAAVVDQRPGRHLAHPGRLPALAPQAELRARRGTRRRPSWW